MTSFLSISTTFKTASTAISANFYLQLDTTLELKATFALFIRLFLSFPLFSTKVSMCFVTKSAALSKPLAILNGWMPFSINLKAYSINIPAKTTTPVVPSPISLS